jgi:hypothetical protein
MVFPFLPCNSTWVTGQTGSGKTRFVFQLLKTVNDMYVEDPPNEIMYCFGIHQPLFEEMEKTIPNITFHQRLPSPEVIDEFTADSLHRLIVLDDLMHRVAQIVAMELLFTQGCHHRRLSVLFITQNIFPRGTKSRTIALNTTYLVMMKNVRVVSHVTTLGRQLFPGRSKILASAFADATSLAFGYLVMDMSPNSEDTYRLRTRVLKHV